MATAVQLRDQRKSFLTGVNNVGIAIVTGLFLTAVIAHVWALLVVAIAVGVLTAIFPVFPKIQRWAEVVPLVERPNAGVEKLAIPKFHTREDTFWYALQLAKMGIPADESWIREALPPMPVADEIRLEQLAKDWERVNQKVVLWRQTMKSYVLKDDPYANEVEEWKSGAAVAKAKHQELYDQLYIFSEEEQEILTMIKELSKPVRLMSYGEVNGLQSYRLTHYCTEVTCPI